MGASNTTQQLSSTRSIPDISATDKWIQNGVTVAGGNEEGMEFNQLSQPWGLYVDDNLTIYVADYWNHRIVEWKSGAMKGHLVAGGNQEGERANQLNGPTDVIVDKAKDNLIISDRENGRVVLWPLRGGKSGKTIISNVQCFGLTLDDHGFVYVSDKDKHEVRRWRIGETHGIVVAGGNGEGDRLDQLNYPTYIFVDRDQSMYVSEYGNQRVTKWVKGAKEGIIVAGGHDQGDELTQLSNPEGVVVDQLGTVYVAEWGNHRVTRWPKGATSGSVVVGGNDQGKGANQLYCPIGLSFDRHGNLYVVDLGNNRVQRFNIDRSL